MPTKVCNDETMNPKPDWWCVKRYAVWKTYQTCVLANNHIDDYRCISDLYQTMSTLRCCSFLQNVKIRSIQIEGSSFVRWKWMHFCRSEWWVVLVWAGRQLTLVRFSMIFHGLKSPWVPITGLGFGDMKKAFREKAETILFEFWMKKFGYLWDLAGFIYSHVCKRSLRHWVSENWSFLFCSFLPKDENRIRRRNPWDHRSFRHNQIHYKIQRVCIVSGHWFEMVDDGSLAVWWYV